MAHIFNYAVLMAIPDKSRGERVNVGLVVFLEDRIDVRFAELAKLRVLTGHDWSEYGKTVTSRLVGRFSTGRAAKESFTASPWIDSIIQASDIAWFSIDSPEEYESRIDELQKAMIIRPPTEKEKPKTTRINTEIAQHLRRMRVLARKDETLDSHKVVRDYFVEDDLHADFVQQNGLLRVWATLDLRRSVGRSVGSLKEAAFKAVVLDRAKSVFSAEVRRCGVYATAAADLRSFHSHVNLLTEYSDEVFNWENPEERQNIMGLMAMSVPSSGGLL